MVLPNWGALFLGLGRPHDHASLLMRETCVRRALRVRINVATGHPVSGCALPYAVLPV